MKRNERLDIAIRTAIETAGCLEEEQLAASVARALRKEGMLSITAESVIAYLELTPHAVAGCECVCRHFPDARIFFSLLPRGRRTTKVSRLLLSACPTSGG